MINIQKSHFSFATAWGDTKVLKTFRNNKSPDVQKADCENLLRQCSSRFERSLNDSVIRFWASDIVDAGFTPEMLEQVCKSIPFRFEKMPSLADIMALLRPLMAQKEAPESELDKVTRLAIPLLKTKILNAVGEEKFNQLKKVFKTRNPEFEFSDEHLEMVILGSWVRCSFGGGAAILDEYYRSRSRFEAGDYDYFYRPLKRFCDANSM